MRAVDILVTAIGNSFRSRLRTTLTVVAIFIGAFTLTITNGLGTGINDYIDGQVASIGAPDVMTVTKPVEVRDETEGPAPYDEDGPAETGSGTGGPPGARVLALTDDDLERIAQIDGIGSVEPLVAVRPDYIQAGDGASSCSRRTPSVPACASISPPGRSSTRAATSCRSSCQRPTSPRWESIRTRMPLARP